MTIQEAIGIATAHHQAGRVAEAEGIYRQILAVAPQHAEALHYLGLLECQRGQSEIGIGLIGQSIAMDPQNAAAHSNLGNILRDLGHLDEAVASFRRAIALQPGFAAAHNNLANALSSLERMDEAIAEYRQAIACAPANAEARCNLGSALSRRGNTAEAIASLCAAIQLNPSYFAAFNNLGLALAREDRPEEAIAAFQNAIRIAPDRAEPYNNMGNVLSGLCRLNEASAAFEHAIRLRPDFCEPMVNLGGALTFQGRPHDAIACYKKGLLLRPDSAAIHSALIFTMHYLPDLQAGELQRELRLWNQLHAVPFTPARLCQGNEPSPERKLRIGYVSPDLREHVVGRTLLPVFEAHDRNQFEIVCYSGTTLADSITERFRRGSALWRDTALFSDDQLADQIHTDRIDILVDLSLHTGHNRLQVFARKPAPVQISWLGYPGAADLDAIDFHITDPFLDPAHHAPNGSACKPLRMPDCWCCYGASSDFPAPGELPAERGRGVTFGSFNNAAKLNPRVIAVWAQILRDTADSRLLLLSRSGPSAAALDGFRQLGIAPERIEFLRYYPASSGTKGTHAADSHLHRYHEIDIALDPFPYNGMTTTCDALWMGVPVVALVGESPVSRASLSLLSNVGLPELAAKSEYGYIGTAVGLARDLPRLAAIRASLRDRMKGSPLLDYGGFARAFEAHCRNAWRAWCATQIPPPSP